MEKLIWVGLLYLAQATFASTDSSSLEPGAHYVNMGSSFAAGSGTGAIKNDSPRRCAQSENNYASQLAARLSLSLDDRSCGGAKSVHLLEKWAELPAQIEAVSEDTRLVTITVGGNDLNYSGNVFAAGCEKGESFSIAGRQIPCPPLTTPTEEHYQQLEVNLAEAARQIRQRAPQARTVFIQYVTLVAEQSCAASRMSPTEIKELRAVAARLAEITARAATENGALVLAMDKLSQQHTPCDPEPWSVGLPKNYAAADGVPWHPNLLSMGIIAERLEALLNQH